MNWWAALLVFLLTPVVIIGGWLLVLLITEAFKTTPPPAGLKRILCWLGLHRWDKPGGHCEDCGVYDDFFDVGEEER